MKKAALLLLLLMIRCGLSAQNIIPRFENIGVNDGLSQSSVYSIYQDKKGFMWFGTADGLNRYDGQNIRIYKINDKTIANSNFVHGNICEDSHANIWFCNETGLFCYNPLSDRLTRRITFNRYVWTAGIFIDAHDVFYCIDPMAGIYGYNTHTNRLFLTPCRFKTPYYNFVVPEMTTNFKNAIWIKIKGRDSILFFNPLTGSVKYYKPGYHFNSIFYALNNKLYSFKIPGKITVTDTAFHVLDTINYILPKNKTLSIQAVYSDNYHRVWISTIDNGLLCYDEKSRLFTHYLHDNAKQKSLPINILSALCIDRSGNLWIGTDGSGVCKLDLKPPKFNLFPLNEGDYPFLKDYFMKCFYEDAQGKVWFGTLSSGLNIYDPETRRIKNYSFPSPQAKGLPGPIVGDILKDRSGLMWVCTSTGIAIFNEKSGAFHNIKVVNGAELNEHNNFVYKLIQLKKGDLMAATFWGLLTISKVRGAYAATAGKPNVLFTDVVEMEDGTFWASSPVHGLYHLKKRGYDFTVIEKHFPLIDMRSIHRDEQDKNTLWICTGIGLIKFNTITQKHVVYDENSGMLNSYIYGVLEDDQHNFWMSTNMGLCFFNRKENTFQSYTAKDGLQSNEFNTQAFYKGPSGTMYFGGIKGFNWFNPKTIKANSATHPGVAITSINIDDQPYIRDSLFVTRKILSLPYDKNNISFQFAALDFTKPQANKVKFILEAWDKQWITSEDKSIRYTHLTPGSYTLRVKAANSDGVWSNEERLTLIVNAPFWQQTWFYVLSATGFLSFIIYVTWFISQQKVKKRIRQLEKQTAIDAERNRISRDMHDEIGSGLTHIALLSELIQTQKKTERAIKTDLGTISASARKLVESMSEIIWALNPQNDSLENLLSYVREQMQQLFEPFALTLKIDFPDEVPDIRLSNEQRRNLYLVTKEALNNVMKHASANKVKLSVLIANGQIKFEVADDGCGMPGKLRPTGNGLKNMRKRMEDIGGNIEWTNSAGGLSVVYRFNVRIITGKTNRPPIK